MSASKQSKLASLVEAVVNTFVGFCVTMIIYPFVNWICDIQLTGSQMTLSTALFTIASIVRGYVIRRFFNNMIGLKSSITEWFSMTWINTKVTLAAVAIHFFAKITLDESGVYDTKLVEWNGYVMAYRCGDMTDSGVLRRFSVYVTTKMIDKHFSQ